MHTLCRPLHLNKGGDRVVVVVYPVDHCCYTEDGDRVVVVVVYPVCKL